MDLTDADIEKITTPLWDRAKAEIAAGRIDAGVELFDEAVSRARELQYFFVNRLTSLMSFIAEELGEEAVERALRTTGERFIRARRDTGVDWGELPASARAKVDRRARCSATSATSTSARTTRRWCCRSGAAPAVDSSRKGATRATTRTSPCSERAPRTFMLDALPVYCAHCSINNEIQPIEWGGDPISIEHPAVAPGTRCVHHVYKDVRAVPPRSYERIGKEPPE